MEAERHIKNWLSAFWYNRSDEEMKSLCEEIKNRLQNITVIIQVTETYCIVS